VEDVDRAVGSDLDVADVAEDIGTFTGERAESEPLAYLPPVALTPESAGGIADHDGARGECVDAAGPTASGCVALTAGHDCSDTDQHGSTRHRVSRVGGGSSPRGVRTAQYISR